MLLTGGSAPGLGAAAGVSAFLRESGYGYRTPYARIPLVPRRSSTILGLGSAQAFPRPDDAYRGGRGGGTGGGGGLGGRRYWGDGRQDPGAGLA